MTAKLEIELEQALLQRMKAMAAEEGKDLNVFLTEQVIGLARGDDRLIAAVSRLRAAPAYMTTLRMGYPQHGA